jgi:hypothetical protein
MKFTSILFTLALVSNLSFANVITVENSDKTVEGVKIARSATLATDKGDVKLDLVGAGLRAKRVAIIDIKVYVLQLLTDNVGKFVRSTDGALKSMDDMNTAALTLTFLFAASADQMKTAFEESFVSNNVNLDNPAIQALLDATNNGGKSVVGKTMTILLKRTEDGNTKLTLETSSGKVTEITGDHTFFNSVASIWLGTINKNDKGLASLKEKLIKGE